MFGHRFEGSGKNVRMETNIFLGREICSDGISKKSEKSPKKGRQRWKVPAALLFLGARHPTSIRGSAA